MFTSARCIRYGFGDDHRPRREIAPRARHSAMPGIFSTRKAARGWLRTSSPLMMDGLVHPETDPRWIRLADYPFRVGGWLRRRDGSHAPFRHVPDVGVIDGNGAIVYIDYVPVAIQRERADFDARVEALRELYREDHGISYVVHDERHIYAEPRFSNLRIMRGNRLDDVDPNVTTAVRVAVLQVSLPATIEAIAQASRRPGADGESPGAMGRVLSVILGLALIGELEIDLTQPLSGRTKVFECRTAKIGG